MENIFIDSFKDLINKELYKIYFIGNIEPCIIKVNLNLIEYNLIYDISLYSSKEIEKDLINNLVHFTKLELLDITSKFILFSVPKNLKYLVINFNSDLRSIIENEQAIHDNLENIYKQGTIIYIADCEHKIGTYTKYDSDILNKCNYCDN